MLKLKYIAVEQLLELYHNNENFKLVEVLPEENYDDGHLPEAINIPYDKLEQEAGKQLSKNDKIVVYCASYTCQASTKAVEWLMKAGYKDVVDFAGGKKAWQNAGLGFESQQKHDHGHEHAHTHA